MAELICYRKYSSLEEAEAVASILKENQIPFSIENNSGLFDKAFMGSTPDHMVELNIPADLFSKADITLANSVQIDINSLPGDYYLFTFTDEELKDILKSPDEWSEQDYFIAQQLLAKRGFDYTGDELKEFKSERVLTLSEPEKSAIGWITFGYVLVLLYFIIGHVAIGFIGVLIGFTTWRMKKILPDGTRAFMYNAFSRKQGMTLFVIALIFLCGRLILTLVFDISPPEIIQTVF